MEREEKTKGKRESQQSYSDNKRQTNLYNLNNSANYYYYNNNLEQCIYVS